jgi:hypothetical protein
MPLAVIKTQGEEFMPSAFVIARRLQSRCRRLRGRSFSVSFGVFFNAEVSEIIKVNRFGHECISASRFLIGDDQERA